MIKYLELTAPETMQLRGAKILRTEVSEGDSVKQGDALFTIINNGKEEPLPASMDGVVEELIVQEGDGISLLTPLMLFQTNIEEPSSETIMPDPTPAKNKNLVTVKVPDIGGDSAKVVEILVKPGDHISVDDPIIALESDKASMEVPSTAVGTVQSIIVQLDADVSQGDALIEVLRDAAGGAVPDTSSDVAAEPTQAASTQTTADSAETSAPAASNETTTIDLVVPDIGGDSAKVVEILVSSGDSVDVDDTLITLESDKASMEVPSTAAGVIGDIKVSLEDDVSTGSVIATLTTSGDASSSNSGTKSETKSAAQQASLFANDAKASDAAPAQSATASASAPAPANQSAGNAPVTSGSKSHASPSIRRFARELGADLSQIKGTGRKDRVTKDDVKAWVKNRLSAGTSGSQSASSPASGSGIPSIINPDFSKFGSTSRQPLNRIKQLTAQNLHRSWLNVPHVTHNDEAQIADLESFRKQLNEEYARLDNGIKLSPLAFIVKAVVKALQKYPQFNSSLSEDGKELILKGYYNVGIAVDTPEGLVVPVIKAADTMSVADIAEEMSKLAAKARDKKLTMNDMSGACFTISSLGGIGGTSFTPIVNAPEVAILGVSRTKIQPYWNGSEFIPAPYLPLSLSYDHRVIDGAEAARFTRQIASVLEDVRRLTV